MPKFRVHLYPEIRVVYDDVEAATMEEAIEKAAKEFDEIPSTMREGYYEDSVPNALVDVEGDEDFEQTTWFEWRYGKWVAGTWKDGKFVTGTERVG